jgi:hypothetical protein
MRHPAVLLAILGVVAAACSSTHDFGTTSPPPPSSLISDSGASAPDANVCARATVQAAPLPLDVVFLLDRSGSMEGPKWNSATLAILDFLDQGFPAPTQVGLNFLPFIVEEDVFGDQIGTNYDLCAYRLYESLVVPLAPVASQRSPFEAAIASAITPTGFGFGGETPLYAALEGSYLAAAKNEDAHPDHQSIVVLLTDGGATPCPEYDVLSTSVGAMAALATSALRYNGVRTFTLALQGADPTFLSKLAAAGNGVELTPATQTEADYLTQLDVVTRSAIGCAYALPPPPKGQTLDPTSVGVDVTATTGDKTPIPRVVDPTSCAAGAGFYLEGTTQPKVVLCPASCAALNAESGSRVDVLVGCARGTQ